MAALIQDRLQHRQNDYFQSEEYKRERECEIDAIFLSDNYAVVIEKGENGYSAYVPDVPDCTANGYTAEEAESNARDALILRIESLLKADLPIPEPLSIRTGSYLDGNERCPKQ